MAKHQTQKNILFADFPPISREEWERVISRDLEGDYRENLTWNTLEGFESLPFYRSDDIEPEKLTAIPVPRTWNRCEPIRASAPSRANSLIQQAVAGGADAVSIRCRVNPAEGALGADITGMRLETGNDFKALFDSVDLQTLSLFFDCGMGSPAIAAMLLNHSNTVKNAALLFDPYTYIAQHGRFPHNRAALKKLISQNAGLKPFKTLAADGLFYQQAGATIVQELGISLSIASEYLSTADESDREAVARSFFVRLSAGPLYFPEIAKFRAIRILWRQLLNAYGAENSSPLWIHAETTRQNKTVTDPHTNLLRVTTEAMAAVLGGVDSLVIHPFDAHYQLPDQFSRRIARNVHPILEQEAHLNKTADPPAGSYYLETLTDTIARKSWDFFREIELQGGFAEALKSRFIQTEVERAKSGKENAYAKRTKVLVGTNHYPNPGEELPKSMSYSEPTDSLRTTGSPIDENPANILSTLQNSFRQGATLGDVTPLFLQPQPVLYPALEEYRSGAIYEEIRLQTEKIKKRIAHRPTAALLPIGNKKWRQARATFAASFLGCAGFHIEQPVGFDSLQEAEQHFNNTDPDFFVLCSSEKEYPGLVDDFCDRFKKTSALLILAGNRQSDYAEDGIDFFIHEQSNLPETLIAIQKRILSMEERA